MNYALIGYGKMGRAVDEQARGRGHRRGAVVDGERDLGGVVSPEEEKALRAADVAFEFTAPGSAEANVAWLLAHGISVVCGTTGWRPGQRVAEALRSGSAGLIVAPNFSVGVNLFFRAVGEAARLYARTGLHEPFVLESHHRGKLDAPSGTAGRLAEIIVEADPRLSGFHAGNLEVPARDDLLQVASIRVGAEPGSHTVGFDGPHDRISLTHSSRNRDGFALGAVLAGEWLVDGERSGLREFEEVLGGLLEDEAK